MPKTKKAIQDFKLFKLALASIDTSLALSMMNFEDGRIRVMSATSQDNSGLDQLFVDGNIDLPGGKRGAYDYFILDYLQNVRMVLTEATHTAANTATMEGNRSTLEESIFGQAGTANEVATTRNPKPTGWSGNSSAQVSKLGSNGGGKNIGPNVLQKVMAGDKITTSVLYYHEGSPGGNNTNFLSALTGIISPVISGSGAATNAVKSNASAISTQLGNTSGFVNAVQPNGSNPSSSTPQAFLTILFFDERFNFIESADGGLYQQQVAASVGSNGATLALQDKKAPKNGYVYVYVSNQSNNHVYFDNFKVGITQGNIVEENHYYAYGLKIAAISARKSGGIYEGSLKNNYLYQGAYSELDDDIGWHDFMLRNYDAQIGRWVQQDPYQEFATSYIYVGGDPINLIDPTGGVSWPPGGMNILKVASESAGRILSSSNSINEIGKLINNAGFILKSVFRAIEIISTPTISKQVGYRQNDLVIARSTNRLNGEDMSESDGDPDKWGSIGRMFAKNEKLALDKLNDLINIGTDHANNAMKEVAKEMFIQFRTKKGGLYYSENLNREIKNDYRYKDMVQKFSKLFEDKIKLFKGDINKLRNDLEKIDITSIVPIFNDYRTGLGVTVDGVNYTNISIVKFSVSKDNSYTATIKVRMFDSFGLDSQDIYDLLNHPNPILSRVLVSNFIGWWVLQHVNGYKHLDVKIENTETISGKLK